MSVSVKSHLPDGLDAGQWMVEWWLVKKDGSAVWRRWGCRADRAHVPLLGREGPVFVWREEEGANRITDG